MPLACVSSLLLGACVQESSLPVATGEGSIRAINAIVASPDIRFLIEERELATVPYKGISGLSQFDDLDYTFNFELRYSGDIEFTRIASQPLTVVAEQDYTMLLSGTVANPVVTVWEAALPGFDAAETIFQASFAHASYLLGTVDYYFAASGVAPVAGAAVATLSFGEIAQPVNFEAGDYVIIITSSGNPGDILYTSIATPFNALGIVTILPFDGDADDNAPVVVRALNATGPDITMASADYPASVEFLHAALDLGVSNIYDDEMLSSLVISDHAYKDLTADVAVLAIENTYRYTLSASPTMVTNEGILNAFPGNRYRFVALGPIGDFTTDVIILDRRTIDSAVKTLLYQTSINYAFLSIYAVDAGTTIDDKVPFLAGLATGVEGSLQRMAPGSYDIYVTQLAETEILAGPVRIDVVHGDVVDMIIVDTVNPAVLEIMLIP